MLPNRRGMTPVVRKLRRAMTEAERFLWSKLRRKQIAGASFYRQRIIGEYIVDFYCREAALVIELDGGSIFTVKAKRRTLSGTPFLENEGLGYFALEIIMC